MVVIDGTRIVFVGFGVEPPEDAVVMDFDGATLLPGLIDTHVHLCFDASTDPVDNLAARDDGQVVAAMRSAAQTALAGGVTTVRDLGDRGYLSLDLRGLSGLPTIVAAGPPITTPAGHCHFLGGSASRGVEGVRAAVREHAERGVDVIKIMASGGNMTPGTRQEQSQFSGVELRAAVDEAHRLGLPITAHAHGTQAIVDAVAAGVDGLEHASFWSEDGVDDPGDMAQVIADRHIVVGAGVGFVPVAGASPPPAVLKRLPLIAANTRRLYEAGALIAAATDAGIAPPKPHDVVRTSLPQLIGFGMTAAEALRTITSFAADICGLAHRKGRIASGFEADLLAVQGNPVDDVHAIHQLRAIYSMGKRVTHSTGPALTGSR